VALGVLGSEEVTTDKFDPNTVPPFPLYRIVMTDDGPDMLDGVPIEPAADDASRPQAAVEAARRKAEDQSLKAVRAVAVQPDDSQWEFVVTTTGDVYDTTRQPKDTQSKKKRLVIGAIGAAAAVAIIVAGGLTWTRLTDRPEPEPPAVTAPQGAGIEIPAGLPDDYSPTAQWAISVAKDPIVQTLNDGRILTQSTDGNLAILNPETASHDWTGISVPRGDLQIHETTWQGRKIIAAATSQKLYLWPLDTGHKTGPTVFEPKFRATTTFAGTAPLIDIGDYTVMTPATKDTPPHKLTLPPGSHPTAVDGDIIRSISGTTINGTSIATKETSKTPYQLPQGATGAPEAVYGLSPHRAIVQWKAKDKKQSERISAIVDLKGNVITPISGLPNIARNTEVLLDTEAQTAVVGSTYLNYGEATPHAVDIADITPSAIHGRTIFGTTREGPAMLEPEGKNTINLYTSLTTKDPAPTVVTDDALYIAVTQVDTTKLYRSARHKEEDHAHDDHD
jgi:hypothetical protein